MKTAVLLTMTLVGMTSMMGMVGTSKAVSLNPEGLGQVLLYPYYTARNGNDTFISVMNTTDQAKSVKVRFLEGVNSREVQSFNLYLAPFDVWVAALTSTANGDGVELLIPDSSCTVPYFFGDDVLEPPRTEFERLGRVEFTDAFFTGEFDDPGPNDAERVQSGHIELIEMGTLVDDTEGSANAATHLLTSFDDVPYDLARPADCIQLVDAWNEGYWSDDSSIDHEPPNGGLRGAGTIINVGRGTMFTYKAEALDGFSTDIIHFRPTDGRPDLSSGNVTASNVYIDGAMDTQIWQTSVEAVSAAIMYDSIINEYIIESAIGGLSEWVVTFPTRHFYTDSLASIGETPVAPFTNAINDELGCEKIDRQTWDRETAPVSFIIVPPMVPGSPTPVDIFELCYGANIVRFTEDSFGDTPPAVTEIMGEPRFSTFFLGNAGFTAGLAKFDFSSVDNDAIRQTRSAIDGSGADTGVVYTGLPAIGFWANTFTNGTLPGEQFGIVGPVLANYGGTFRHSGSRAAETVQPETP